MTWQLRFAFWLLPVLALARGAQYRHQVDPRKPWSIHVVRLPRKAGYIAHAPLGGGTVRGLEPLSKIVARLPADPGRPVVAVNGDFYRLQSGPTQGDPNGLQIVDGELVSGPAWQSFWFDARGDLHFAAIQSRLTVRIGAGKILPLRLNCRRDKRHAVLFTPRFGADTGMAGGLELVLAPAAAGGPWLPLRVQSTIRARVEKRNLTGTTPIPRDRLVLSLDAGIAAKLGAIRTGTAVEIKTMMSHDLSGVQTALGGGPMLLRDGKVVIDPERRDRRHPRTAIGCNRQEIILVVVDGRQPRLSVGMDLLELAGLMQSLGCVDAMNLDGGGSSTLWFNGKVVNSPSGNGERPLGNALVFCRQPPRPDAATGNR